MRYRVGVDVGRAMIELGEVARLATPHATRPPWLPPTGKRPAFYLCAGRLTMPVIADACCPGRFVIVTVLPPVSARPNPRSIARRRRRALRAAEREGRRDERRRRQHRARLRH
jgi:hypothetical protein